MSEEERAANWRGRASRWGRVRALPSKSGNPVDFGGVLPKVPRERGIYMSGHGTEKGFLQSAMGGILVITLTVLVCGGIFIALLASNAGGH